MSTLNFGILSTASVNNYGFLPMVKQLSRVKVAAIASRDMKKAKDYAANHGIRKAYGDYDSLLADAEIDCVYIPLPNSMHAEWAIKALDAGKHVLCEKPVAANAMEAAAIAAKVKETGLTFAEAFHYRYHPLLEKLDEIVRGGEIGEVRKVFAQLGVPLPDKEKVQFKPELAGGALMDVGCYPASFCRWIADGDNARVTDVHADMTPSGVDGTLRASFEFDNGVEAGISCSIDKFIVSYAEIKGTNGVINILAPFHPVVRAGPVKIPIYLLLVRKGVKVGSVRVPRKITYYSQLAAFCKAVRTGANPLTTIEEGVANMRLLDAIKEQARGASR